MALHTREGRPCRSAPCGRLGPQAPASAKVADSTASDHPGARALLVEGANHNLASPDGAAGTFVHAVGELLDEAIDRVFTTDEDF